MKKSEPNSRRKALKGVLATLAVGLGVSHAKAATPSERKRKKIASSITKQDDVPLFSGALLMEIYCLLLAKEPTLTETLVTIPITFSKSWRKSW